PEHPGTSLARLLRHLRDHHGAAHVFPEVLLARETTAEAHGDRLGIDPRLLEPRSDGPNRSIFTTDDSEFLLQNVRRRRVNAHDVCSVAILRRDHGLVHATVRPFLDENRSTGNQWSVVLPGYNPVCIPLLAK